MTKTKFNIIHEVRTWLGLNQAQFAALLGFSVASLNRYENGATPTNAHRSLIQIISDPQALHRIIQGKENIIDKEIYQRVLQQIASSLKSGEFKRLFEFDSEQQKSEFTGNQEFTPEKLKQLILFFTSNGEWKTKLNKLLFYSDFLAFKVLNKSITGTKYVVGTYGPIPDEHEFLFAVLLRCKALENREEFKGNEDIPFEKLYARETTNLGIFTQKEVEIIKFVFNTFRSFSAKKIADYSHEDTAWKSNTLGESISYKFAKELRLNPNINSESNLWFAIQEVMQEYKSDLEKLPPDASINIDHYLYGSTKK